MSDFDLTPPSLPGEAPVKRRGFFGKLFRKDSNDGSQQQYTMQTPSDPANPDPSSQPPTPEFTQTSTPPAIGGTATTPNIDEIRRKLGIDAEQNNPPAQQYDYPDDDHHENNSIAQPAADAKVDVDDWTQDESASTITPVTAPAATPWDNEISLDDIAAQSLQTPSERERPAQPAPFATTETRPETRREYDNDDSSTDNSAVANVTGQNIMPPTEHQDGMAMPLVIEGTPKHHELIEEHLAALNRQHEEIEKKLSEITTESPRLPEWKLQEREVTPDKYFFLRNGQPIRSLPELADALEYIDDITFEHHVNEYRNDFASWVRDALGNQDLATQLLSADNRAAMLRELLNHKQTVAKSAIKEHRELQKTIAKRKEAVRTLLEAEKEIAELQRKIAQKSKELMGERKRSAKLIKERLDAEVERRLKAERNAMLKARGDLAAAKKEYSAKQKDVDAREKAIAQREKRVMLDETEARKDIEMVSRMKQEIEPMLRDAAKVKADMEIMKRTEASAKSMLAQVQTAEAAITRKEEALRVREKKMADDITKASTMREELRALKADLDARETTVRKTEVEAKNMLADAMSRRDAALTAERTTRERINAETKKLNALKAKIEKELAKTISQKEKITRAVGLRKEYAEALGNAKRGITAERERLESEGYASFIKERVDTTPVGQRVEENAEDALKAKHGDIYAKIESCRQSLETGDLEKAKAAYKELRDDYTRAKLGATEKEALYNDIREIYDDIHLMMLAKQQ